MQLGLGTKPYCLGITVATGFGVFGIAGLLAEGGVGVDPGAYEHFAVGVRELAEAEGVAVVPLALVGTAFGPGGLALAVSETAQPVSLVYCS